MVAIHQLSRPLFQTPHQEAKYALMVKERRVDIRAPAGAGKTFLALKALVDVQLDGSDADGCALYFTRNEALCLHVAKVSSYHTSSDGTPGRSMETLILTSTLTPTRPPRP